MLIISVQEKRTVISTLADSWDCGLRPREISRQLDNKQLVQYTIHISRPENFFERTQSFIADELQNPRKDKELK